MTWSLVGVGAAGQATSGFTSLGTLIPAGCQENDLLIFHASSKGAGATLTVPTGFTLLGEILGANSAADGTGRANEYFAYCIRGASDPGNTAVISGQSNAGGRVVAYRSSIPGPPTLSVTGPANRSADNVTAVSLPGITTASADELVIAVGGAGRNSSWTNFAAATDPTGNSGTTSDTTNPPGSAWKRRGLVGSGTGTGVSGSLFDVIKATAGATGNFQATGSAAASHTVISASFKEPVAAPVGGKIKVWNGSAWVEKPVKVMHGAAVKPVKFWTGTEWKLAGTGAASSVAYRDISSLVYGSRTNSVIDKPATLAQDDVMLMSIFLGRPGGLGPPVWPSAPSGWNWVDTSGTPYLDSAIGGFYARFGLCWKAAGGSEPSTYTITHDAYSSNVVVGAYSGVNTTAPIDGFSKGEYADGTSDRILAGFNAGNAKSMLVGAAYDWADTTSNEIPPTDMVERYDAVLTSWWDQVLAASGPTGSRQNVCNSAAGNPRGGFLVALKGI